MQLNQALIKRIKELIKNDGMSQYKLSQLSGVPQSTISMILKGKVKTVKMDTLFDLCFGLNKQFKDFFDCEYFTFENVER